MGGDGAAALARVLVASAGRAVVVPDKPVAAAFRRGLDALLPPRPPAKTLALAGPGLPATDPDIVLVPRHPQTGEAWPPPPGAGHPAPLSAGVWMQLAFHHAAPPSPSP
jgi:hypothetical protein